MNDASWSVRQTCTVLAAALAFGPMACGRRERVDLDAAADGDAQLALDLAAEPGHHARREGVVEPEGVADRQALLTDAQAVAAAQTHRLQRFLRTRPNPSLAIAEEAPDVTPDGACLLSRSCHCVHRGRQMDVQPGRTMAEGHSDPCMMRVAPSAH